LAARTSRDSRLPPSASAQNCIAENHTAVGNQHSYAGLHRNAAGGWLLFDAIHPLRSLAIPQELRASSSDDDRAVTVHRVRASSRICNALVERVTANRRPQLSTGQNLRTTIAPHRRLTDSDAASAQSTCDQPSIV